VSPVRWALVVLAVVALCAVIVVIIAAGLDFVGIGLIVVGALAATYYAGRLDNRRGDGEASGDRLP
jgi:hypothetical protein